MRRPRFMQTVSLMVALFLAAAGCATGVAPGIRPDGGASRTDASTLDAGLDGSTTDGSVLDAGSGDSSVEACSAVSAAAETVFAPVDIVWSVDNSGSMSEEAALVQTNLNRFAETIEAAGIDVHVVLITAAGFVEVPAPLGTDPERFLRVEASVASHNTFDVLLDTFSSWEPFLRPEGTLHVVITTDDESSDWSWSSWDNDFTGRIDLREYYFHAICSPPGSTHRGGPFNLFTQDGCEGPNGEAEGNGNEYWNLADHTGGEQFSICTSDWSALFDTLATAVAVQTALPCEFGIPEPPEGETFDPALVNVDYTSGEDGSITRLPYAGSEAGCGSNHGWYYDASDPAAAENIVLCPATCGDVEIDEGGTVDIAFGCETVII